MIPLAYPILPLTVGQLATFRFDGVAAPNDLWRSEQARLKSLAEMLEAR